MKAIKLNETGYNMRYDSKLAGEKKRTGGKKMHRVIPIYKACMKKRIKELEGKNSREMAFKTEVELLSSPVKVRVEVAASARHCL